MRVPWRRASGLVALAGAAGLAYALVEALREPDPIYAPAPGLAHLFALPMNGQVYLSVRFYLYGDQAPTAVSENEPRWQAWLAERFPMPAMPT